MCYFFNLWLICTICEMWEEMPSKIYHKMFREIKHNRIWQNISRNIVKSKCHQNNTKYLMKIFHKLLTLNISYFTLLYTIYCVLLLNIIRVSRVSHVCHMFQLSHISQYFSCLIMFLKIFSEHVLWNTYITGNITEMISLKWQHFQNFGLLQLRSLSWFPLLQYSLLPI